MVKSSTLLSVLLQLSLMLHLLKQCFLHALDQLKFLLLLLLLLLHKHMWLLLVLPLCGFYAVFYCVAAVDDVAVSQPQYKAGSLTGGD